MWNHFFYKESPFLLTNSLIGKTLQMVQGPWKLLGDSGTPVDYLLPVNQNPLKGNTGLSNFVIKWTGKERD